MRIILVLLVSTFFFLESVSMAKEKEGPSSEKGEAQSTSYITGDTSTLRGVPGNDGSTLASCTYWWITGQNHYNWSGVPCVALSYDTYGRSFTEYGTATSSCGTPLIVDSIYVGVQEYPLNSGYIFYDQYAYNTNFVDKGHNATVQWCATICGVKSYHVANKNGISWNTVTRSGCAP